MARDFGTGSVVKLRYKDSKGKERESRYWYILYRVHARQIRESSESESKMVAEKLLQRRLGEHGLGIKPEQDVKNVRYEDVRDSLLAEYKNKRKGSIYTRADGTENICGLNHLDEFFKDMRVVHVDADLIRRYIAKRRAAGAKDPTIRRNLVILRSMLNLARKEGKIRHQDVPHFPMPQDSDAAGQYLEPATFAKLLAAMPKHLHPFLTFLYATGCRLGAAKAITWAMVSKDASEIEIPGPLMKARSPLTIVLAGKVLEPVAAMLRKMFRQANAPVFDVTNLRGEWNKHCGALGLGEFDKKERTYHGLRIHDLRCSAAINLIDAGVAEDTVMKIGGWKTKAMFSRYNVMNTNRIRAAMIAGGDYVAAQQQKAAR